MKKGEQSKRKLMECAAKLFWENGYNATGINDILTLSELPKGSFYFYFKSKKDLALEVALYYEEKIIEWIRRIAEGKQWEAFISDLAEEMQQTADKGYHFGCPFAVMGLEVAFSEPSVAARYTESLEKIKDVFASVLLCSGIPLKEVNVLAERALAIYEGELLFFRMSKDTKRFQSMRESLIVVYQNFITIK